MVNGTPTYLHHAVFMYYSETLIYCPLIYRVPRLTKPQFFIYNVNRCELYLLYLQTDLDNKACLVTAYTHSMSLQAVKL